MWRPVVSAHYLQSLPLVVKMTCASAMSLHTLAYVEDRRACGVVITLSDSELGRRIGLPESSSQTKDAFGIANDF